MPACAFRRCRCLALSRIATSRLLEALPTLADGSTSAKWILDQSVARERTSWLCDKHEYLVDATINKLTLDSIPTLSRSFYADRRGRLEDKIALVDHIREKQQATETITPRREPAPPAPETVSSADPKELLSHCFGRALPHIPSNCFLFQVLMVICHSVLLFSGELAAQSIPGLGRHVYATPWGQQVLSFCVVLLPCCQTACSPSSAASRGSAKVDAATSTSTSST